MTTVSDPQVTNEHPGAPIEYGSLKWADAMVARITSLQVEIGSITAQVESFQAHAVNNYGPLLAALKALENHGYREGLGSCICLAHENARAVIAKAERREKASA